MAIKSESELRQEWGLERLTKAYNVLCKWYLEQGHGHPFAETELQALANSSRDAFDLFATRTIHHSRSNEQNEEV